MTRGDHPSCTRLPKSLLDKDGRSRWSFRAVSAPGCVIAERGSCSPARLLTTPSYAQVSKSYLIAQETTGKYYYPRGELGIEGERCELPRPLKEGEHVEWIELNGTPGTSAFSAALAAPR